MQYGDYLYYMQVDEVFRGDDGEWLTDGIYDYVKITDCDMSATEIEIPSEIDGLPVKLIDEQAFYNCKSLTSVNIPDSVTEIWYSAFWRCTSLTSINIPDSVVELGANVFGDTPLISGQTGIKYVDNWIVEVDDESITDLTIPDGVYGICNGAFSYCTELTSVVIPESVSVIGSYAFGDPLLETGDDGRSGLKNLKIVEIRGNGLRYIGYNAFAGDTSLESITLPDSIEIISGGTFACTGITDIVIPESVKSIGHWGFYLCEKLESITILNPECEIDNYETTISNSYNFVSDGDSFYIEYPFEGIIYGYTGSTAQAYAENYNRNFTALDEAVVSGDANGDGELDIRDASFIARKLAQRKGSELPISADYNDDGIVDIRDASAIARYLANSHK